LTLFVINARVDIAISSRIPFFSRNSGHEFPPPPLGTGKIGGDLLTEA
jgi:hypothetical protein